MARSIKKDLSSMIINEKVEAQDGSEKKQVIKHGLVVLQFSQISSVILLQYTMVVNMYLLCN